MAVQGRGPSRCIHPPAAFCGFKSRVPVETRCCHFTPSAEADPVSAHRRMRAPAL